MKSHKIKKSSCKEETIQNSKKYFIDPELEVLINEDLTEYETSLVTTLNKKENEEININDIFYLAILNSDIFSLIHYLNHVRISREIIFQNGMTPLILSIKSWKYRIAYCLIKITNNIDYIDFLEKDALFYALQNAHIDGDYRISKIILEKHPNPYQTLFMLINDGKISLIKFILENINNINNNQNIFDIAIKIYSNDHPIVELLNKYK